MPLKYLRKPEIRWILSPGVRLGMDSESEYLIDEHFHERLAMNGTARALLALCDGRRPTHEVFSQLAKLYRVPAETVSLSARPMLLALNERGLIQPNCYPITEECIVHLSLLLRLLGWSLLAHPLRFRLTADLSRMPQLYFQVMKAVYFAWRLPWWAFAIGSSLLVFFSPLLYWVPLGTVALYAALTVHELGHIVAARLVGVKVACIHYRCGAVSVVRPKQGPMGEVLIGLGGPLLPALIGVALLNWDTDSPLRISLSAPFLLQPITLLPLFDDSPLRTVFTRIQGRLAQEVGLVLRRGHHRWTSAVWQTLVGTIAGTFVFAVGLIALGLMLGVVADIAGWPSFNIAPLGLPLYSFQKGAAGFTTELGDGLYCMALAAGLLNGVAAGRRSIRNREAL